jgi:hypothetical protein
MINSNHSLEKAVRILPTCETAFFSCNHLHFVSYWIQLNTPIVLQTRAFSRWLARFADGQIQMRLIARIQQAETGNQMT